VIRRVLSAALAFALLAAPAAASSHGRHIPDPRRTRGLFVDPWTSAAQAGAPYASLAAQPQAFWLTDAYPIDTVRAVAHGYARRAVTAGKTPVVVLYAIPDRDCGGYAQGGEPSAAAYRAWIVQAAAGLKGSHPLVVLEPDALPFLGDCPGQGARLRLLRQAVKRLDRAGSWVYLDAGHDRWQPARVMARRLAAADIAHARGFSLDVSNFGHTADEKRYAKQVLAQLGRRGIHDRHYVVDTSRNGGPKPVEGDVCNPVWARVGTPPRLVFRRAYDGSLWIKHPGESDGPCNGGPSAGQWSDLLADRLLGRA
jgi:endoglucanase